jgi:hypothetical protein
MRATCSFCLAVEVIERSISWNAVSFASHSLLVTAISGSSALPSDKPQSPKQPREG